MLLDCMVKCLWMAFGLLFPQQHSTHEWGLLLYRLNGARPVARSAGNSSLSYGQFFCFVFLLVFLQTPATNRILLYFWPSGFTKITTHGRRIRFG